MAFSDFKYPAVLTDLGLTYASAPTCSATCRRCRRAAGWS